jgi:hypothetical protein
MVGGREMAARRAGPRFHRAFLCSLTVLSLAGAEAFLLSLGDRVAMTAAGVVQVLEAVLLLWAMGWCWGAVTLVLHETHAEGGQRGR